LQARLRHRRDCVTGTVSTGGKLIFVHHDEKQDSHCSGGRRVAALESLLPGS